MEKIHQNMVGPIAEKPNFGVPPGSVASRGVPRRPFDWSVVSHSPLPYLGVWKRGRPTQKILPNLEKIHQNMAGRSAE